MKLSDFDFHLPEELIAQQPASPREAARLLFVGRNDLLPPHTNPLPQGERESGLSNLLQPVLQAQAEFSLPLRERAEGEGVSKRTNALANFTFSNHTIADLPDLLRPDDLLVFNDTKVIPARLYGKRGEAKISVTLHKQESGTLWQAFAKPARKLKLGDTLTFGNDFAAHVAAKHEDGSISLHFNCAQTELFPHLHRYGQMPLPPYIKRERAQESDKTHYQTSFARKEGAVAAPTAGLHFTPALLDKIRQRGIETVFLTLHVGAGTFLPVKTENVKEHRMHAEYVEISQETSRAITEAKRAGRRIVAVGTTSLRSLEAFAHSDGSLSPVSAETDIFITPGYHFKMVDVLITNFHLPKSTLFMLVSAFSGLETMKAAYTHAIERKYRFFSYGDACLLER